MKSGVEIVRPLNFRTNWDITLSLKWGEGKAGQSKKIKSHKINLGQIYLNFGIGVGFGVFLSRPCK